MAISRQKKVTMTEGYVERLAKVQAMILTDYRGLTVANIADLRAKLREAGGGFQVVKNNLFLRALAETGLKLEKGQLTGPLGVGYVYGDIRPVVKALIDFAKESQILKIQGAILGHSLLDAADAKALADLPPREVLLAQLLGSVQAPMSSLVGVITAPLRELVQVLQARSESGQEAAA